MLRQSDNSYELSPIQAGMLVHATMQSGSGIDVQQIVAHLEEHISVDGLIEGWRYAMRRHPVLRTSFRWLDCPQPLQQVQPQVDLPVVKLDWSDLDHGEQDARLSSFLSADRRQGFDLGQAPLARLTFIRTPVQVIMVWTFHHILLDGRAFPSVLREVFEFTNSQAVAQQEGPPAPIEFRKHVEWLNARDDDASEAYWKECLAGFRAPVRLWVEQPNSSYGHVSSEFGNIELYASVEATAAMHKAASAADTTMNILLQGAWALLLNRLSGETDIVFGATRACRRSGIAGTNDMVGILINTLPVRVNVDPAAELKGWLRALRAQSFSMRPHEHTPLTKVQAWSDVERGRLLFESIVVYEHLTLDAQFKALGGEWQQRSFQYIGQTNFPLALIAYGGERLQLRIEYARDRFDDDAAGRILRYLEVLLVDIAKQILGANGPVLLNELRILPADERAELLTHEALPRSASSVAPLPELFEGRVRLTPDAEAVVAGEERLTYRELNARANRLAHALRQKGVQRNDIVGLAVERNSDVAVGILAILKAGAAYLPLDPDYPRDRLAFVVDDAKARLVLASSNVAGSLQLQNTEYVDIATAGTGLPDTDPDAALTPDDLAYVIYTSGSTGKPKGVLVTHANVTRLFSATDPWFAFGPHDTWTLFHSYAFDFSVWELWGALLYGGRLVIVPYWVSRDPAAFRKLLVDERVTILNQTPSAFRQLIQADLDEAPVSYALREVIFGGEALELQALKPWIERYGDTKPRLVNMYGITETTVHVTYRPITRADVEAGRGSVIGSPIPDLYIRLLDERQEPVPVGVPGEIWVGGAGVANGYLNQPDLTAQRFVTDPFDPTRSARLYRAGDLARRLPDGELEFLGRIDNQVKIRGFRIELGEIEAALNAHPLVRDSAVITHEAGPGDVRIIAYIVVNRGEDLTVSEVRRYLRTSLPDYMIPSFILPLQSLPLTANGKLDRSALPDVFRSPVDEAALSEAPAPGTEQLLANIWCETLQVPKVHAGDNFFDLGGHSLLAVRVVVALERQIGWRLDPRSLFFQTLRQLAAQAEAAATRPI